MSHPIYFSFQKKLEEKFPQAFSRFKDILEIKPELISPFVLPLPKQAFLQAENFIDKVYELWQRPEYHETLLAGTDWERAPDNSSVMTCFDFHYSEEMGLKLIEVNTNASLFWPFQILRQAHSMTPINPHGVKSLKKEFLQSYHRLFSDQPSQAFIIDKDPKKEGLYFEFFLFQDWFESLGIKAEILSIGEFNQRESQRALVYNRTTDFFLQEQESEKLRQLYLDRQICLTPHPLGYLIMADKRQLDKLRQNLATIDSDMAKIIPETKLFREFSSNEEIWSQRKKYFFKPSNSYGGKAAFTGRGISKKMFQSIAAPDYIAQELAPAGKMKFTFEEEEIEHKFDLRFYTNREGIIDVGARLYQGQTTNMKTRLGGIAPVQLTES